jgi:hypothetical protein
MAALHAAKLHETQWHPQVQPSAEKCGPYTITLQHPIQYRHGRLESFDGKSINRPNLQCSDGINGENGYKRNACPHQTEVHHAFSVAA